MKDTTRKIPISRTTIIRKSPNYDHLLAYTTSQLGDAVRPPPPSPLPSA